MLGLELGVRPKALRGPWTKAMIAALESYHVSFSLIPAVPGRGRSNKRKRNSFRSVDDDDTDKDKSGKRPPKGSGKSKGGKGKEATRDPPLPAKLRELKGKGTLPDGRFASTTISPSAVKPIARERMCARAASRRIAFCSALRSSSMSD